MDSVYNIMVVPQNLVVHELRANKTFVFSFARSTYIGPTYTRLETDNPSRRTCIPIKQAFSSSSDNPSVYNYGQTDGSLVKTNYLLSSSRLSMSSLACTMKVTDRP